MFIAHEHMWSVFVTFPGRNKRVYFPLSHSLRAQSFTAGKARQQEHETAGHIVFAIRKRSHTQAESRTLGLSTLSRFIHLKAPAHGMVPPAVLGTPSQTRPETSFRVFCFLPMAVDLPVIFIEKENPFSASLLPLLKDKPCCTHPHGRSDICSMGLLCLKCRKVRAGADRPISA